VSDLSGETAAATDAGSGRRPIYSIGAVARMLGIEPATLRAWEERYGVVVPARSAGAQRVYSRDELERLRFIVNAVEGGATAAEAHRLLREHIHTAEPLTRPDAPTATILVLLAERDRYAAELCEYFLRTEGYDVCLAFESTEAQQRFMERTPDVAVVELMISGGGLDLCRHLTRDGAAPVLAVSALNLADEALTAGASAYLAKPFEPLQFVSTVRDLLGASALTRRPDAYVS
jgi:DNA-binding transcriptional MerR regulator